MKHNILNFQRAGMMRHILLTLLFLFCWGGTVRAQDFKLYFANNISDVTDVIDIILNS